MDDPFAPLTQLLTDVILPNLKSIQESQAEQIAANDSLEREIEDLQANMRSQFALLNAQLTTCRGEIAALHAALDEAQAQKDLGRRGQATIIH